MSIHQGRFSFALYFQVMKQQASLALILRTDYLYGPHQIKVLISMSRVYHTATQRHTWVSKTQINGVRVETKGMIVSEKVF